MSEGDQGCTEVQATTVSFHARLRDCFDIRLASLGNLTFRGEVQMANNLQIDKALSTSAQPVQDQNGANSALAVSTDKVGIGTTNPTQRLTLGSGNVSLPNANAGADGNLYFGGITDNSEIGMRLFGGEINDGLQSGFVDVRAGTLADGLRIRVDTFSGGTERMRVTASGNVGIGTPDPLHLLQIGGGFDGHLGFGGSEATPNAGYIRFGDYTGWKFHIARAREKSAGPINNGTTGSLVTFQDNGNVGIGTTNPLHMLQIGGGFDGHLGFGGSDGTPNAGYLRFGDQTGWKFHIARAREKSAGSINAGTTGSLVTFQDNGNVGIGTTAPTERLEVNGSIKVSGDILLANADCAEDFNIGTDVAIEPGTVMVVGAEGALFPCLQAYDKRVAGVVSGAGDYKPGIVLDKQQSASNRQPIALLGKVYCKVDAQYGAIEIGDSLTTSPTPGHAMKVGEPLAALGAMLGKALSPLKEGQGLIPVLIALQ
ncbi:hypothetical protein QZJ86_18960 [Methylomonas montana]|uniref:hypothetical protein n=1 Tax=Methylomonas montana TaxID=3058963 RepID=UPI00265B39D3|nr:hypothetical protein [Methylomonas montana]WKJ90065.1 hypothetical protein QZJ86_18960 [Methylomonas montana]